MSVATLSPASSSSSTAPSGRPLAAQPYLSFEGRCEEALAFYQEVLGAQVTMKMNFGDAPPVGEGGCAGPMPPANKVMHAAFRIGQTELFATDGRCQSPAEFKGIALSLPMPDIASAERAFNALAAGGAVQMPLAATFFAKSFGMVADKFGVTWMVIVPMPM